jgi:hypothetical protein
MDIVQLVGQSLVTLGALGVFLSCAMYIISQIVRPLTALVIRKLPRSLFTKKIIGNILSSVSTSITEENFRIIKVFLSLCIVIFLVVFFIGIGLTLGYNLWVSHA